MWMCRAQWLNDKLGKKLPLEQPYTEKTLSATAQK